MHQVRHKYSFAPHQSFIFNKQHTTTKHTLLSSSMMSNTIAPLATRLLGISFRQGLGRRNPRLEIVENSFTVNGVPLDDIVDVVTRVGAAVEFLGSFLAKTDAPVDPPTKQQDSEPVFDTKFALVITNFGCNTADMTGPINVLQGMPWKGDNGVSVTAAVSVYGPVFTPEQFYTLLGFRQHLPSCDDLKMKTLVGLYQQSGTVDVKMSELLNDVLLATPQNDPTATGGENPTDEAKWARELFNRLTTGGPNGSMAGKIAVEFMNTLPDSLDAPVKKRIEDKTWEAIKSVLQNVLIAAGVAGAQALSDYLKSLPPSTTTGDTRQVANVVKGIKDSMPGTGKTVAQLAVFKALQSTTFQSLPASVQLRAAYTIANSTRAAIESVGNHTADLYQANALPTDEELSAVGARDLLSFLKQVGSTVANGVVQAAPVIFNAISTSLNANNALGSALPPSFFADGQAPSELSGPAQMVLASRIVNATPNPQSTVVTDKAVSDLADRQSNLGSQATFDTFQTLGKNPTTDQIQQFRKIALDVAAVSPTFSNVTDIGATNLVTDTSLNHADALRQHTLEMGISSCANMLLENPAAETLYKVHLHRVKMGLEAQPRDFLSFLKNAVPIAANIAKVAAPALLALL